MLSGKLDELSQICLANATNRIEISTGAIILGEVASQTKQTHMVNQTVISIFNFIFIFQYCLDTKFALPKFITICK